MKTEILSALLALIAIPQAFAADRPCAACGAFYPSDKKELSAAIDSYMKEAVKPPKTDGMLVGIMAPHAGYVFSARNAASAYLTLSGNYDTVVLFGSGHTKLAKGALAANTAYATPLGTVQVDGEALKKLLKAEPLVELDNEAHKKEHSVEVQLPFLQKALKKPFKILPLTLNYAGPDAARRIGAATAAAVKGKKALFLLSTDLSHYPDKDTAPLSDKTMLAAMETMDPFTVLISNEILVSKRIPGIETAMCGASAAAAFLQAVKSAGADTATLLAYSNSAESPMGEEKRVVGYGSMSFTSSRGKAKAFSLTDGQKKELLAAARKSIADEFSGKRPDTSLSQESELNLPAAVFVTLTKDSNLRGCIGTTEPAGTLLDSVNYFSRQAAFADHRFPPLTKAELDKVKIEISVLTRPAPVSSDKEIKPGRHGVTVERDGHRGLFLPQVWKQLPDKETFLGELCSQKAGLERDCWKKKGTKLMVFEDYAFSESGEGGK